MGSNCSCQKLIGFPEELDMDKEKKVNKDFFLDQSSKASKDNNNIINRPRNNTEGSEDIINNELLLSTQSYTNFHPNVQTLQTINNNKHIEQNNKFENGIIFEEEKEQEESSSKFNKNEKKPRLSDISYKTKVIFSASSELRVNRNESILEEEYNYSPNDEYSRIIFNYINKLRTEPKSIAQLIENNKKYIFKEENQIFFQKNRVKFSLHIGEKIFDEAIQIFSKLEPMKKLIFNKKITVELPDNEDYINNLDYLKYQIEEIQNNGNHVSTYWKEKIKDPEIAFLMMVVDDNYIQSGLKRKDLINPEIKYIGIISIETENNFACYITLSNRK